MLPNLRAGRVPLLLAPGQLRLPHLAFLHLEVQRV